ncbi:MAG: tRNA lysidine(34) synthetase TilS, partial [Clostridia bacterium]|nr:tRNA lysidine(34) synthetase TilS [Clostridia bacterium]
TPFGRVSVRIDPDFSMEKTGGVEYNTKKPADRMGCMMDLDSLLALADGENAFFIRSRRAGDRFRPVNSDFRMKLKDFFISRKVDASKRDGIPLVVFGGEIVFIPGFLISDTVKLTGGTRSVLTLQFTE